MSTPMDPDLFKSAKSGNVTELKSFAEKNPEALEDSTPNGNTALHIALQAKHTDFALEISRLRPSLLLKQNSRGDTPLHVAAKAGHLTPVRDLICQADKCFNRCVLTMENEEGNTVLHEAAKHDSSGVVFLLMRTDRHLMLAANKAGASALYVAAEEGIDQTTERILAAMNKIPDAYWEGPNGRTPLHAAVIRGHIDIIRVLCDARPEFLREKDTDGSYPIHYAAALGNLKIVRMLLEYDKHIAYFGDRDNRWPFHLAASNGHTHIMKELLQRFPDSGETSDNQNWNALHIAVERGNLEVVRYILNSDKLAELINEGNKEGNTPLHLAIFYHQFSISLLLLKDKRVEFNVINRKGQTAMDIIVCDHEVSRKLEKILIWKVLSQMGGKRCLPGKDDRDKDPRTQSYKGLSNAISTVAGLIITVSFAAAFTIPGGYIGDGSNKGKATLAGKPFLWIFIITDSLALFSSTCIALLLFFAGLGDNILLLAAISRSLTLMAISLLSLTLSFLSGISLVLSKWHAVTVCLICIGFFFSLLHWLFSWAPVLFLYFQFSCESKLYSIFGLSLFKSKFYRSEFSSSSHNGERAQ
ncbi:hypothetical protein AAC387_Pa07g1560 [Persea americana]